MNPLFSIISLLMVSGVAFAYKTGAPVEVCESMVPEHGVPPQTGAAPFILSVDKVNIKPGGKVTLKISSSDPSSIKFKGFFAQARNGTNHIVNGTFGKVAASKVINCPPGNKNAVTHANPDEKSSISIPWTAPQGFKGAINFVVTVVQNGETFWVNQKTQKITIQ